MFLNKKTLLTSQPKNSQNIAELVKELCVEWDMLPDCNPWNNRIGPLKMEINSILFRAGLGVGWTKWTGWRLLRLARGADVHTVHPVQQPFFRGLKRLEK